MADLLFYGFAFSCFFMLNLSTDLLVRLNPNQQVSHIVILPIRSKFVLNCLNVKVKALQERLQFMTELNSFHCLLCFDRKLFIRRDFYFDFVVDSTQCRFPESRCPLAKMARNKIDGEA